MNSMLKNLLLGFFVLQLLILVHAQSDGIPPKLSGSLELQPIQTSDIGGVVIIAGAGGFLGHVLGKFFDKIFLDPLIERFSKNPFIKRVRKIIVKT